MILSGKNWMAGMLNGLSDVQNGEKFSVTLHYLRKRVLRNKIRENSSRRRGEKRADAEFKPERNAG